MTNIRGQQLETASYTDLGTFTSLLAPTMSGSDEKKQARMQKAWSGSISLVSRPELPYADVARALESDNLDRYFVAADQHATTRCIDGRCIDHYGEHDDSAVDRPLGAQTPGGTVTAALCHRVAAWGSLYTDSFTLTHDVHELVSVFKAIGLMPGGHTDDVASGYMTGCGAIDRIPQILEKITIPETQEQVRDLAKLLLGELYDRNVVDAIMGRLLSLESMSDEYFQLNESGEYGYRQDAIRALQHDSPNSVTTLIGSHKEVGLVVNLVKDTTFHRDEFAKNNDFEIELFNYDLWRTHVVAGKLYPTGSRDSADRTKHQLLRQRFITARALFAIGTCMVLTDGSLRLIVRQPTR